MSNKRNIWGILKRTWQVWGAVLSFLIGLGMIQIDFVKIAIPPAWTGYIILGFGLFCISIALISAVYENLKLEKRVAETENEIKGFAAKDCISNADQAKDEYAFKIVSPKRGANIDSTFDMTGTYQKQPSNEHTLVVFVVNRENQQYWPARSELSFDVERKAWHAKVYIGGAPGTLTIVVAVVGRGGQTLLDYYFKVVAETGKYPSIHSLTPDTIECDEIMVILTNSHKTIENNKTREKRIEEYLQANTIRKLQLGAGRTLLPGWLCTDRDPSSVKVMRLDVTEPFPCGDALFDYIFSEHLIEHFSWSDSYQMILECRRVLKPGGIIRIATPDLSVLLGLSDPTGTPGRNQYIKWITDTFLPDINVYKPQFVINNALHGWGHQFLYDDETLELALRRAGFEDITRCNYGESTHEHLRGLEHHGENIGAEEIAIYETMVYEAKRPE